MLVEQPTIGCPVVPVAGGDNLTVRTWIAAS